MTILESGAWIVPAGVSSVDVLVVGGGGGGGGYGLPAGGGGAYGSGGGGGGGQGRVFTGIAVAAGYTADITIGAGGAGGSQASDGSSGEASTFLYGGTSHTSAGGAGGSKGTSGMTGSEGAGGSGGTDSPSGTGGGDGGDGGNWSTSGAAGLDGPTPTDGLFAGNTTPYGGGGGGGSGYPMDASRLDGGAGGGGGGGAGGDGGARSNSPNPSTPGADGRGGGGGGGSQGFRDAGNNFSGAQGGTGVIVVRTATLDLCDGSAFADGDGSDADPYQISNATQLAALANDSACYAFNFIQTADIALTGAWTPIGDSTNTFQGTYDGDGNSITGLVLPQQDFSGLFGVTNSATIANLRVSGSTVPSTPAGNYTGVLIGGAANTDISNIDVTASIEGTGFIGGAIGYLEGGSISSALVAGSISGSADVTGGLVGGVGTMTASITGASVSSGTVDGAQYVGGVIGRIFGGSGDGELSIAAISSSAQVSSSVTDVSRGHIGGAIGSIDRDDSYVRIVNSTASGSVTASNGSVGGGYVGGFVGSLSGRFAIQDSSASGDVAASYAVGGFVGSVTEEHGASTIARAIASGDVTAAGLPVLFVGGFFGLADATSPRRITIDESSASGSVSAPTGSAVGGFGGRISQADIQSSHASGIVIGLNAVGGFIGMNLNSIEISNSYASGDVDGNGSVGGFVGRHETTGTLVDVYATGRVRGGVTGDGTGWEAGGLVGLLLDGGAIERAFATGNVSGVTRVGGLVGELDGSATSPAVSVTDSYATGNVTASDSGASVGAIVGINRDLVSLSRVYATGAVSSSAGTTYRGGVTGEQFSPLSASSVFWNTQTTGTSFAAGTATSTGDAISGATGLSSSQMRSSSSFIGWNFTSVWGYQCGVSNSPELRWANSQATSLAAGACATPSPDSGGGFQPAPSDAAPTSPTSSESTGATGEVPPTRQPPGSASMFIDGQPIVVQEQQLRRGQGLGVSAGPVAMSLRSTTPSGRSVPLAPDGSLLLARSGELPITASGLAAGSEVTVTLFSDPISLGTTTADQNGDFASTVGIPSTTPLGSHTLRLRGTTNTGEAFALDIGVSVVTPAKALGANPILLVKDKRVKGTRVLDVRVRGVQARCLVTLTAAKEKIKVRAKKTGTARAHFRFTNTSMRTVKVTARVTGKGCARVQVTKQI